MNRCLKCDKPTEHDLCDACAEAEFDKQEREEREAAERDPEGACLPDWNDCGY